MAALLILVTVACGSELTASRAHHAPPTHHAGEAGPAHHPDGAGSAGHTAKAEPARPTDDPRRPGRDPPADRFACRTTDPPCIATMAVVIRIVDGDTAVLWTDGGRERVRLIGVDAPETWARHDCFGTEATQALQRLIPPGSVVHTIPDTERRDRFGRLLLYLWTPRGDFVNAALVQAGFARTMTVPPDTSHASTLHEAERTAQRAHRGLWRSCL